MKRKRQNGDKAGHAIWVRMAHWFGAFAFFALVFSGVVILMCHPRLYWGEVGNDLTPALFEFPISKNFQHGGWDNTTPFYDHPDSPLSASRTFEIFNQNGWGRSLHFLAAWVLVFSGLFYFVLGLVTQHFWKHLIPFRRESATSSLLRDIQSHLRLRFKTATGGPQYNPLQKWTYSLVIFFCFPLAVVTGLAMSPAVTAEYPFLYEMFGGFQSARTIHFFVSVCLVLFLMVHVIMVILSGFKTHLLSMTVGK